MLEINLKKCSRCKKDFTDIIAAVKLDIEVFRLDESDIPEQIANLDQESHEFLCKECFDDFASVLEQMNLSKENHEKLIGERSNCECEDKKFVEDCLYDD